MANLDFENFIHNSISETLRSILFQKYIKKKQVNIYKREKLFKDERLYLHENNICVNQSYILHLTSHTWKKDFARQYWFNGRVNNNLEIERT